MFSLLFSSFVSLHHYLSQWCVSQYRLYIFHFILFSLLSIESLLFIGRTIKLNAPFFYNLITWNRTLFFFGLPETSCHWHSGFSNPQPIILVRYSKILIWVHHRTVEVLLRSRREIRLWLQRNFKLIKQKGCENRRGESIWSSIYNIKTSCLLKDLT